MYGDALEEASRQAEEYQRLFRDPLRELNSQLKAVAAMGPAVEQFRQQAESLSRLSDLGLWKRRTMVSRPRSVDHSSLVRQAVAVGPPKTREELAAALADYIRRHPEATRALLAEKYREAMVSLGMVRRDSIAASALRRMKEFLSKNVYGPLIPPEQLPERVRSGIETGGRPNL